MPALSSPLAIGLTGGIGSGKTTVAGLLAECGACVVDTDAISRELTAPGGAALEPIAGVFGLGILTPDGALDREQMRALAFGDLRAKARLESILHPLIGAEAARRAAAAGTRPVVYDVPLLAESSRWRQRVDRIVVVDCPTALQVRRVVQRSAWSEGAVLRVIDQQASAPRRRSIGDAVIDNGEAVTLAALACDVRALWAHWVGGG